MRSAVRYALLTSLACTLTTATVYAQETPETNRKVAGGGISVKGWQGKIDADAEKAGQTVADAKLSEQGKTLQVTTGPAITYWNPANVAKGDYTVSATFTEPKFQNLNTHPHPYGIVIAGNGLGTADQSYIYCAAYGNGNFIVRGFGPAAFQMNGRGAPAPSVDFSLPAVTRSAFSSVFTTVPLMMQETLSPLTCMAISCVTGWPTPAALCTASLASRRPFSWKGSGPKPRRMKLPLP